MLEVAIQRGAAKVCIFKMIFPPFPAFPNSLPNLRLGTNRKSWKDIKKFLWTSIIANEPSLTLNGYRRRIVK